MAQRGFLLCSHKQKVTKQATRPLLRTEEIFKASVTMDRGIARACTGGSSASCLLVVYVLFVKKTAVRAAAESSLC